MAKLNETTIRAFCAGFGLIAGYTNVICLVRYQSFGTMMTGNLLMMAKTFAESGFSKGDGIMPLPIFFAMVIVCRNIGLFVHYVTPKVFKGASPACVCAPLLVLSIFFAEASRHWSIHEAPERWNVFIVAMAFGVQSAVTFPAMGVPTMLATGHMTNMYYTCMEVAMREKDFEHLQKIITPTISVVSILLGAVLGAFANQQAKGSVHSSFLLTPITVAQAILLVMVERAKREVERSAREALMKNENSLELAGDTIRGS